MALLETRTSHSGNRRHDRWLNGLATHASRPLGGPLCSGIVTSCAVCLREL